MATLRLEIVTPETTAYSEDVDFVTLPGTEGEFGVYPRHVPLLTAIKPGELRVLKDGRETFLAIGEGFAEIRADAVSVLTDMALESEKIDTAAPQSGPASSPRKLALPDQPSIVVLPFMDMSPKQNEEHFADGITEDLITQLARIRWLFVIARNSAFVYKDRAVDVKQVSLELGVRYVLEGSVRRSGRRMRISAQLVDATTGVHQWAERYDRDAGEMFAVQDEITSSVAAAVEPQLISAEGIRTGSLSSTELSAWELVARAQYHF